MAFTVRRFAPHEWRLYRELRLCALVDSPDAFGSTFQREATRADSEWQERLVTGATAPEELPVLALIDDVPVGLAWARVDDHDRTVAYLYQVWVAPNYRGRGVGRRLTDAAIEWARTLGVHTLRLGVTSSHPAAFQLYRHVGFVAAGEPEPLRPDSTVLCQPMQLVLGAGIPDGSA
jgi:ribosomal protein S18 acetylase RimI-like enzyme